MTENTMSEKTIDQIMAEVQEEKLASIAGVAAAETATGRTLDDLEAIGVALALDVICDALAIAFENGELEPTKAAMLPFLGEMLGGMGLAGLLGLWEAESRITDGRAGWEAVKYREDFLRKLEEGL